MQCPSSLKHAVIDDNEKMGAFFQLRKRLAHIAQTLYHARLLNRGPERYVTYSKLNTSRNQQFSIKIQIGIIIYISDH